MNEPTNLPVPLRPAFGLSQTGSSLVELAAAVAVVATLLTLSYPACATWLPDIRLNRAVLELYGALLRAKGEAAKRNQPCTLSFNQEIDGIIHVWVLYEDRDRDLEYDPEDHLIQAKQTFPAGVSLDKSRGGRDGVTLPDNDRGQPSVSFLPTTIPINNEGEQTSGGPFLMNSGGRRKKIDISQAGGIRIREY